MTSGKNRELALCHLADCATTPINAGEYGRLVHDLYLRRELIGDLERALSEAYHPDPGEDAADIAAGTADRLQSVVTARRPAGLQPINMAAWQDRDPPERQWLVPDWIPSGYASSIYGDGGTGKSLFAMMLATACAVGRPWLGMPVTKCRSVGLFCEDSADELIRRQSDICRALGISMADVSGAASVSRVGADNALMVFGRDGRGELTPLWHDLRAAALDHGARLVIVDTAADSFGGDELRRSEVRQFISAGLGRLAREIDGVTLVCAHPSLSGMSSGRGDGGSTAWSNTVRSRLYLSRPAADDGNQVDPCARILSRRKANYAGIGEDIRLRWDQGVFRIEGAPTGGIVGTIEKRNSERAAEEVFFVCLREVHARGQQASDSTSARDRYAPKLFRTLTAGRTFSARELTAAMNRLLERGTIRVESVRNASRNYVSALVEVVAL